MDGSEADEAQAFVLVVALGSFAAAARRLGRDPSIVSRRVAALESRLGVRLLERSTRQVTPTDAGRCFADGMQRSFELAREAADAAREATARPAGLLRVSLPALFGRLWIAPLLPDFLALFPLIRLHVGFTDRMADLVADAIDVAVRIGDLPDTRLVARRLATTRRVLCASPAYLARRGVPARPDDLLAHDCLAPLGLLTHPVWHFRATDGTPRPVRIEARLEADEPEALLLAARAGAGIGLGADWLVHADLAAGRLVPVLPDWSIDGGAALHMVRASNRHTPARTRAFIDWLTAELSPVPWSAESAPGAS